MQKYMEQMMATAVAQERAKLMAEIHGRSGIDMGAGLSEE